MDDLLKKDYARKVNCQDIGPLGTHWYLPHHPVFHPKKPDKVRVVFDFPLEAPWHLAERPAVTGAGPD